VEAMTRPGEVRAVVSLQAGREPAGEVRLSPVSSRRAPVPPAARPAVGGPGG